MHEIRDAPLRAFGVAVLLLAGTGAPRAGEVCDPERVGVEETAIRTFVADVQTAVAAGDSAQVAALAYFPIRVNSQDPRYHQTRTLIIGNARELADHAPAITTEGFRRRVRETGPGDLICPSALLGFTGGVLWARVIDGKLLITAINNDEFTWPGMTDGEVLADG